MMLKEQARKYQEELSHLPVMQQAPVQRCGVRCNMTLDRELNTAEQTATRLGYAEAAGVPVENVEICKDGQSIGTHSITVYVKDAATAAAVSSKLSDPAVIESALISVVLSPDPHPSSLCMCARPSTLTPPLSLPRRVCQ